MRQRRYARVGGVPEVTAHDANLPSLANRLARVGGWAVDVRTGELDWSDGINLILEYPLGAVPDLDQAIGWYPEPDRSRIVAALDRCRVDGVPFDLELWTTTATGRRIRVRAVGEAERDEQGATVRVHGAFQDISDRYELEQRSRSLADRLESTIENMSDALFIVDHDWNFTFLNRRSEDLLQRSRTSLLGTNIWVEFAPAVGGEFYQAYHRAVETGQTQSFVAFYDPLQTWFDVSAYPTPDGLAVYFRDVNDRIQAQQELERRQAMLEQVADAIIVRTLDHRILDWSGGAEQMYGWSSADAIGASIRDLLYDAPDAFEHATETVMRTGMWSGEIVQRHRDGAEIVVQARWTLILDDDGLPDSILAINSDITEQKRIETQFFRAQRLESIGTLASGIAHDLNNVLAPILMAADMLTDVNPTGGDTGVAGGGRDDLIDLIRQSTLRGSEMVRQVLSFARGIDRRTAPVHVASLLAEVGRIVNETFPKSIRIEIHDGTSDAVVSGDATQLNQVLLNLCVNARDAMPDGGTLSIRSRRLAASEYTDAGADREWLSIRIEDSGTGMAPDVLERAIEPFFTTKSVGDGTGLGLSTSFAIVKAHSGTVTIDSSPGHGTVVEVTLPVATTTASSADSERSNRPSRLGGGRLVLLVDDEATVRRVAQQILESYGYRVVTATNGSEAVDVFRSRPDIDVVFTDVMMPVLDGVSAARVMRSLRPEVPIVLSTGLHTSDALERASELGIDLVVPKPFTAADLVDAIAESLDHLPR